jgi:hypothetical protein
VANSFGVSTPFIALGIGFAEVVLDMVLPFGWCGGPLVGLRCVKL